MKNIRSLILWVSLALALSVPFGAGAVTRQIGGVDVSLPAPDGFAAPDEATGRVRTLGESMTPPTNRLLEIFVSNDDLTAFGTGKRPSMQRYFLVQTLRQTEAQNLKIADFATVRNLLRGQAQEFAKRVTPDIQKFFDNASPGIGNQLGVSGLSIKVGEIAIQDVFDERQNSISLLALTKYAVQAGNKKLDVPVVMAMTTMLLHGKIVYFYAYSGLKSVADADWVRAQTRAWVPVATAENQ